MREREATALIERVREFARARTPSLGDRRAVVAVSGGADSAAALALLCEAEVIEPGRSVAAHFDHRLRGADSAARDLAAVTALCSRYGIELITGAWGEPRAGEAAAREGRYAFLREAARAAGIGVVATGHTADDQAETVLLHAARGAGLHGLRGMAAELEAGRWKLEAGSWTLEDGGRSPLVRPLLCVTREETRGFCARRGIVYVDDETNADRAFARNRMRLDVLPALAQDRADVRGALLRLAAEARTTVAAMEAAVAHVIVARDGDVAVLSRAALRALPEEMAPYAYRLALEGAAGHARDIERKHYAMLARAAEARTGGLFQLPHGVTVVVQHDTVVVSAGAAQSPSIDAEFEAAVPFEGVVGGWSLRVAPDGGEGSVAIPAGSVVRRRRPGDRMRLRGGTKKLQDVFVDLKVPRRERDSVPLIASGARVLWTPFVASTEPVDGPAYRIDAARVVR